MTHRRYPVGHSERKSDKLRGNLSVNTIPGLIGVGNILWRSGFSFYATFTSTLPEVPVTN